MILARVRLMGEFKLLLSVSQGGSAGLGGSLRGGSSSG